MDEIALLGNAAAVPIIMAATQLLKKNFSFRYKADVVSFAVALIVCPGWWFYYTPEAEIIAAVDGGVVEIGKFLIQQSMISVATWMTASKTYDLTAGNKKRADKHISEKQELHNKITELEYSLGGDSRDVVDENPESVDRLRQILEG